MKKKLIYTAIALALTTACSDDYFNKGNDEASDYIGFKVELDDSGEFQSRAGSDRKVTIDALDASIDGKQLYLHTEIDNNFPRVDKNAGAESRGTEIEDGYLEEIRVSALVFDGEWGATGFDPQPYMNNDLVEANSSWNTGRFWPRESEWIRFYAHAPIDVLNSAPNNIGGIPFPEGINEPSFRYIVPGDTEDDGRTVLDQQDLLVASAQYAGDHCQTAHLEFGHALTAVEIKISKEVFGFTLTSLTIEGLYNQGTYTYKWDEQYVDGETGDNGDSDRETPTHDAGSWSGHAGSATYTVFPRPVNEGETAVTSLSLNGNTDDVDMTANGMVLLLMPQQLPETAIIKVEGKDYQGDDVPPLIAHIGGTDANGVAKAWEPGKRVVYTLSFNSTRIEYHLDVTPTKSTEESEYYLSPYHGETAVPFIVKCYKQTVKADGEATDKEPVEWAVDETTLPWWVDQITASGKGPGTGDDDAPYEVSGTYSVLPNLVSSTSHNELSGRSPLGTEDNPYDLSTLGGSEPMTTANCYMVSAPGWYTFPLVYGNAIKDGSPNEEAYLGDTEGSGTVSGDAKEYSKSTTLYNIDGEEIKDETVTYYTLQRFFGRSTTSNKVDNPWIVNGKNGNNKGEGNQPTKSKLLQWQDEPCLLSNVKLNDNEDYVIFYVNPKTINEGNALIAVRDSIADDHEILWSWHIWVTDLINRRSGNGAIDFSTPTPVTNRMVSEVYDASKDVASEMGHCIESSFHLMQSPIGGCDADTKRYDEVKRSIKFKILDENGDPVVQDKTKCVYVIADSLCVGVAGAEITMLDNAPYYQFGRKDPMLPGWPNANPDGKTDLDEDCKPFFKEDRAKGFCGTSLEGANSENCDFEVFRGDYAPSSDINHHVTLIGNPMAFFCGDDNDVTTNNHDIYKNRAIRYEPYTLDEKNFYINKWNAACYELPVFSFYNLGADDLYNKLKETIEQGVIKTVYDPSPRGYELPRIDAFSGTTFNGMNSRDEIEKNWYSNGVWYDFVNVANVWLGTPTFAGVDFYTTPMPSLTTKTGDTFYIPALGLRDNDGNIAYYNSYGSSFTASPICAQWYEGEGMGDKLKFVTCRFCYTGTSWMRPFSGSDLDKAFPIIPAQTGSNPKEVKIDKEGIDWSGNDSDISVGF